MEGSLLDALKQLTDHDLVEDVRGGVGLLAAVQLRQDLVEDDPALGARVGAATREAGVLVRPLVGGALAVSPPLTIEESQLQEAVDGLRAASTPSREALERSVAVVDRTRQSPFSPVKRIRPGQRGRG